MGCDIHLYVEVKKHGIWESVDKWKMDKSDPKTEYVPWEDKFYNGRNYRLFSALADVRNGWGFAGCDTGDRIEPIHEPRGMPRDCDRRIKNMYDWWGSDAHSASYLTLEELDAYNWGQTITIRGFVSPEDREAFEKEGKHPESWCGWTNRDGHSQIQWQQPLSEMCGDFMKEMLPKLRDLGDPNNVRIVFWFDN